MLLGWFLLEEEPLTVKITLIRPIGPVISAV